jgi:hypothetical protein
MRALIALVVLTCWTPSTCAGAPAASRVLRIKTCRDGSNRRPENSRVNPTDRQDMARSDV